jgi:DDE superfamily endonuclease/Helix-turn-helix of DDE superfamily endonuclease
MSASEFKILAETFSLVLHEIAVSKKRLRAVGGGRIGALEGASGKLFFILFYLKIYPTIDLGAFIFNLDRSRVCRWINKLLPLLEKSLGRVISLPKRRIATIEELEKAFPEVKDFFIDATERPTQRPKSSKLNKKRFSGKKRAHTRKNTIISDVNKRILFVSSTKDGKMHDLKQLKSTGVIEKIPPDKTLWVDKGYQGLAKLSRATVMMPTKKPKNKPFNQEQKTNNLFISSCRMVVEHAIAGIKRLAVTYHKYRNKLGQDDKMFFLSACLWNFHLQYK